MSGLLKALSYFWTRNPDQRHLAAANWTSCLVAPSYLSEMRSETDIVYSFLANQNMSLHPYLPTDPVTRQSCLTAKDSLMDADSDELHRGWCSEGAGSHLCYCTGECPPPCNLYRDIMHCSGVTMVSEQLLDLIKWPSEGFSWRWWPM